MWISYWKDYKTEKYYKIDEDTNEGMSFLNSEESRGIEEITRDEYLEALKEHQEDIGELWDANEECWHKLDPTESSGIRCTKCGGWYCY